MSQLPESTIVEMVDHRIEAMRLAGLDVGVLPVILLEAMPAPYNPRKISDDELARLEQSIEKFGVVDPVIVNRRTSRIVGGHQRVKAAASRGLTDMPVAFVDLSEAEERELNLALNKISGDWDDMMLAQLFHELSEMGGDLAATGFSEDEIDKAMGWTIPEIEAPTAIAGSAGEFLEMTFVLSEAQAETVKSAVAKSIKDGNGGPMMGNENKNGCALYAIVAEFLDE